MRQVLKKEGCNRIQGGRWFFSYVWLDQREYEVAGGLCVDPLNARVALI